LVLGVGRCASLVGRLAQTQVPSAGNSVACCRKVAVQVKTGRRVNGPFKSAESSVPTLSGAKMTTVREIGPSAGRRPAVEARRSYHK
jgi:hypothetical protein